jgi:hypothetical protein
MIRFQVVERGGADLYRVLRRAMRSKELRTFYLDRRGRRVSHANPSYTGWIHWMPSDGVINCEIVSPRDPGGEWRLFSAFVGRLADRFADLIHSINVQFDAPPKKITVRKKISRARRKR